MVDKHLQECLRMNFQMASTTAVREVVTTMVRRRTQEVLRM